MDTKTLKVGQAVLMSRGTIFLYETKVVTVTPDGVEVDIPYWFEKGTPHWFEKGPLRFDRNGRDEHGFELLPVFDTKTLVAGRLVVLQSACYGDDGEVVEVTPEGAVVVRPTDHGALLHFDKTVKDGTARARMKAVFGT